MGKWAIRISGYINRRIVEDILKGELDISKGELKSVENEATILFVDM